MNSWLIMFGGAEQHSSREKDLKYYGGLYSLWCKLLANSSEMHRKKMLNKNNLKLNYVKSIEHEATGETSNRYSVAWKCIDKKLLHEYIWHLVQFCFFFSFCIKINEISCKKENHFCLSNYSQQNIIHNDNMAFCVNILNLQWT